MILGPKKVPKRDFFGDLVRRRLRDPKKYGFLMVLGGSGAPKSIPKSLKKIKKTHTGKCEVKDENT